jgi:hypothetical protein
MAPKSEHDSNSKEAARDRLPFEPNKSRKQADKKAEKKAPAATAPVKQTSDEKPRRKYSREETAIPDVISKRMVRRMALFSGIPTALGISTFFVSYLVVSNDLVKLPHVAVVLLSMGFFGLGVLGLTYGVLSASWDEETPGSPVGWSEFTTNLGRMTEAWRSNQKP